MEKKLYETMLLVDAGIGDEGIPEIIRHATELMGRYGGEIERVEKWGEGELAYSIAGTTHGIYLLCYFRAESENVSEIRRLFNLSESILRFLLLNAEEMPPVTGQEYDKEGNVVEQPEEEEAEVGQEAETSENNDIEEAASPE